MSQHHAQFTWGTGPQSVYVAGGFNDWSGNATPLTKQADGSFSGQVAMPWGEKQAFKYVVDGEWKVREDEAKEWDAAGNMNNVYTAPHEPVTKADPPAPAPVAPAPVAPAPVAASGSDVVQPTVTETTPALTHTETAPSNLLASSAPGAASIPFLGAVAVGGSNHHETSNSGPRIFDTPAEEKTNIIASEPVPVHTIPTTESKVEPVAGLTSTPTVAGTAATPAVPTHDETTTTTNATAEEPHGLAATAQGYAAGALGVLGAAFGSAAVAVERATGVDLLHGNPEAKDKGIDVDHLNNVDATTDTTSPAGTKPPAAAVADLEEKVQELKLNNHVGAAPGEKDPYANAPEPLKTEGKDDAPHDIPAQDETTDEHKLIPAPVISAVSERDPRKDRTITSTNGDTAGTKPISDDPAIDAAAAKHEAETHPGATGSKTAVITGGPDSNTAAGETIVDPTAKSTNLSAPTPPSKDEAPKAISNAAANTPIGVAGATTAIAEPKPVAAAPAVISSPTPALNSTSTPAVVTPAPVAPATPVKSTPPTTVGVGATTKVASHPTSTPENTMSTPTKQTIPATTALNGNSTPTPVAVASPSSTAAGSPAHKKESTSASDIRKRKSSFFTKIKHAFSPKDKEKK